MKNTYDESSNRKKGRHPAGTRTASGNFTAGRGNHQPPVRSRSFDEFDGVYQNLRFINTIASLIGNTVQVQLVDGKVLEGIFTTFSPKFEVVLEVAHQVDPENPDRIDIKSVEESVVLGLKLIVSMVSRDVDLDYTLKDTFLTDSAISRSNGTPKEKELEPWDGGNPEDDLVSLDADAGGWNAAEMFQRNERIYNLRTNFEEDLSQYTTKLEKKDTKEYKELEEKATRLASTIESSPTSRDQAELENLSDEEEKFSAVVRPERNGGREVRDNRDGSRDVRDNRDNRHHGNYGGFDRGQQGSYPLPRRRGGPPPGRMPRSTPSPHSHHGQHFHQGLGPRHSNPPGGAHASYHGPHHDSDRFHPRGGPHSQGYQGPQGRSHFYGRNQGYSGPRQGPHHPADHRPNCEDRRGSKDVSPTGPVRSDAGRERKPYLPRAREDNLSEMKKFAQEFRLQEVSAAANSNETKRITPSSTPSTLSTPSAVTPTSPPSNETSRSEAELSSETARPKTEAAPSEIRRSEADVSDEGSRSPAAEVGSESPGKESDVKPEEVDNVSDTLKKSNLNPNAKEFVFNPNARIFTPRSPNTPTPPRSQTPQTPQLFAPAQVGPMCPVVTSFSGVPGCPNQGIPVMPAFVMPTYVSGASGTPMQPPNPAHVVQAQHYSNPANHSGNYRFRKSAAPIAGNHRPDLASPMQVAAATGQPLLAPGPMGTSPFMYQSHQGPSPHCGPVYAVRLVTPQGMSIMGPSSLSYQESPTANSGPIFMSAPMNGTPTSGPHLQHPNGALSPAQAQGQPQLPQGNSNGPTATHQQFIYQPANHMGPMGPNQGPSFPVVIIPPTPNQGPSSSVGNPQGVQIYPLGSSPAGMAAVQMGFPHYQFIQQGLGPGQNPHMQHIAPHNNS